MAVDTILGLQWGDEGKGKIVDILSGNYDAIARFQGGPNAGHTIIIGERKYVLHQVPSGATRAGTLNIIGNGVVLDPIIFLKEIEMLRGAGIEIKDRLIISSRAALILPFHPQIDKLREEKLGAGKIGSTLKGISPAYQDKVARNGLRVGDILKENFVELYEKEKARYKEIFGFYEYEDSIDDSAWLSSIDTLKSFRIEATEYIMNDLLKEGKNILAEGAQGSMLDIDFGSYPFVTSSNTIAAAACTGLGIPPKAIRKVFGIFKAYTTRVGSGPYPTELQDETGDFIRKQGKEFGSTTGRPRRCGWLDLPALKYAIMLSGVDELIVMKMDVLNELEEIQVCTKYEQDGTPVYKAFAGWNEGLKGITQYAALPEKARTYLEFIEAETGLPISLISIGPERSEVISRG